AAHLSCLYRQRKTKPKKGHNYDELHEFPIWDWTYIAHSGNKNILAVQPCALIDLFTEKD
ncbi:MAG: hypothetical protein LW855_06935, partial [Alphaproteobacteria bacterium]|nr:hypothetical protein [Alphaproteobacteria bacterium]